jgi:glucans biosynthesis protein C
MQHATNVQTAASLPARPAVAAKAKADARLAYIDTIRIILTILVIMVHAAVTYGAFGDWTYNDNRTPENELISILLSLFLFICQSFFMGLFFFFSGYFTPGSYDRKGLARFWKDRLLRLGIPMLAYTYFLSRIPNYINAYDNHELRISFWQFTANTALRDPDGGPTWFLFALLVFSLGYTLWRIASRTLHLDLAWASRLPAPGTRTLLVLGLFFSAAMFTVAQFTSVAESIQALNAFNLFVGFFPTYIVLYAGGMLAYRNDWLARFPRKMLRFWAWFSAALIVLLPTYLILGGAVDNGLDAFVSGPTWQCAGLSLWFGCAAVAFSITLSLWLRERVLPHNKLTALAGPNTFAVYLIHPLVLVPITYWLSFIALPGFAKFGLASLLTVVICYVLAAGLRRLPGARAVL